MRRSPLRAAICAALAALGAASAAPAAAAAPAATGGAPAPTPDRSSEPWWVPVGLGGEAVVAVSAHGSDLVAATARRGPVRSDDGGASFHPSGTAPAAAAELRSGGQTWTVRDGRVEHAAAGGEPAPDPGSPRLGAGPGLLAAPASRPGTAVAVADEGAVWRRDPAGGWSRVLLLLPRGLWSGPPRVTGVTAFTEPLSDTVYLATDGYSVLASTDGGIDWIRAGPGLPDGVLALAADPATASVYAGTRDGLWVHHLRPLPAPPAYVDTALQSRQLGTAAVTLGAAAGAVVALALVSRRRRSTRGRARSRSA